MNKNIIAAAIAVIVLLGGAVKFTLPVEAKLEEHIAQVERRDWSYAMKEVRRDIEGLKRDIRIAEEQGWPPHDMQDLRDLLKWYKEREQDLLYEMRKNG